MTVSSSTTKKPKTVVDLVPWDPESQDHVERMYHQRVACGWKSDYIEKWKELQREGKTTLQWVVCLFSIFHTGNGRVWNHGSMFTFSPLLYWTSRYFVLLWFIYKRGSQCLTHDPGSLEQKTQRLRSGLLSMYQNIPKNQFQSQTRLLPSVGWTARLHPRWNLLYPLVIFPWTLWLKAMPTQLKGLTP